MRFTINVLRWLVLASIVAGAAKTQAQPSSATTSDAATARLPSLLVSRGNTGAAGPITGMGGGTYVRTGADLTILDDETLRVLPTLGKGSLQNLSDILYFTGVVQADALAYAKQHDMFPGLTENIRYIARLYDEEVHDLPREDITRPEDLNGQRIGVGVIGSGSAMTAEILLDALGIKPNVEHDKQVNAVQKLKRGEIAAIIHVGSAPIPLLADVSAASELHFLPIRLSQTFAQTYLPDKFTHDTYPALVPSDAPVPTIAVGDVLATFASSPRPERYNNVGHFVEVLFNKFDQFQQPPRHPKWREVNLTAEMPGWTRLQAAQDWLVRETSARTASAATQVRFNASLAQTNPGVNSKMADAERDKLFQRFVDRDRQRSAAL
jgi:TRAP-type uncharacterized transport system substrate-binding protein